MNGGQILAAYFARRLLQTVPTVLLVSVLVFLLMHMIPGDPVRLMSDRTARPEDLERLRSLLGLDQPLHTQYVRWLGRALRGDLGRSIRTGAQVVEELSHRLPRTILLTVVSLTASVSIGVIAGVISSTRRGSSVDAGVMICSVLGMSIPAFWLGLILILLFSVLLGWLPSGGAATWRHIILPAFSLAASGIALIARMTRSTMLECLGEDYIRTARAKGLSERSVLYKHALKNAMIPTVTVIGLQFGVLMAGAVITETIFSWPGMGWLLVRSIHDRDFPVVQGALLISSTAFILTNLTVDLFYGYLDPRIRYQ